VGDVIAETILVTQCGAQNGFRVESQPERTNVLRRAFLHLRLCMLTTRTIENEYRRNLFDVRDGADKIHGLPAMTRGRYGSLILHEIRSSLCVDLQGEAPNRMSPQIS
jgi:hypothetical protein